MPFYQVHASFQISWENDNVILGVGRILQYPLAEPLTSLVKSQLTLCCQVSWSSYPNHENHEFKHQYWIVTLQKKYIQMVDNIPYGMIKPNDISIACTNCLQTTCTPKIWFVDISHLLWMFILSIYSSRATNFDV